MGTAAYITERVNQSLVNTLKKGDMKVDIYTGYWHAKKMLTSRAYVHYNVIIADVPSNGKSTDCLFALRGIHDHEHHQRTPIVGITRSNKISDEEIHDYGITHIVRPPKTTKKLVKIVKCLSQK